jgi:hypothetical protein
LVAARGGPTTLQDSSFTNRAKYMHSEKVMRQALAKAHEYERASAQKRLEQKDEDTHAALLRAARARAEVLHRDDVKATHVTDVRPPPPSAAPRPRARCGRGLTRGARQVRGNLERQLEATQNILALHESRLESLMSERRRDTIQAAATQRDENALSSSRDKMETSVATLQSKVASMKAGLKKEEAEAEKKGAAPALEKMLRMYTSKEHLEHSRAHRSPPRPPRARPAPAPRSRRGPWAPDAARRVRAARRQRRPRRAGARRRSRIRRWRCRPSRPSFGPARHSAQLRRSEARRVGGG